MKKALLALTVLGACAGAASAQSNVTIYGAIDIGIAHENTGAPNAGTVTRLDSGNVLGSRLGFKGTEDLGGGLSANFTLENGFSADAGTLGQGQRLFGRQAWVGLSGGFGSLSFGRQYTPMWKVQVMVDPFGLGLTGGAGGNTGAGMLALFYSNTRIDNSLKYGIKAGAFSSELAYSFGEQAGDTSKLRQIGLNADYKNGPVYAGFAYHNANDATGNDSTKVSLLAGTYDFGAAKLHAAYAWNKGTGSADSRDGMIGVSAPVGTGTIMATYMRHTNKATSNADSNQFGLGYIHPLSKRTSLYTSYSRNANDSGANLNAGALGATDTLINLGVTHKF